jgi:hemerythrin superfamily protein
VADVFEVLRADHRATERRLDELLALPHERSEQRIRFQELTQELVIAESQHEAIEEIHIWPLVGGIGDEGAGLAETGLAQENDSKWVLHQLHQRRPEDAEFDELLATFSHAARQHIRFEEDRVWPVLAQRLDGAQREALGEALERSRTTAPTRPHPGSPQTPGALGSVGRVTGLADRALDALTGRGRRSAGEEQAAGDTDTPSP